MTAEVSAAGVRLLADHSIIDTAPFFLPAFLVAGVLVAIVVRDRRRRGGEDEESETPDAPEARGVGDDRAA